MSETLIAILLAPLGIVVYGSGLLLWPLRRRLRRKRARGKSLGFVFLAQLLAYAAVACCSIFIHLGHVYYWFIVFIELNIVFTIAAGIAWIRDARYERNLEAVHAA